MIFLQDVTKGDECAKKLENEENITKKICVRNEKSVLEHCLVATLSIYWF